MSTPSEPGGSRPDPGLDAIMSERRRLINLAYRLLGSLADAEDVVQEGHVPSSGVADQVAVVLVVLGSAGALSGRSAG